MKKLTKLFSIMFVLALISSTSIPALAVEPVLINSQNTFEVCSEEFPDAYIIVNEVNGGISNHDDGGWTDLGRISATVFVEEHYGYENGEKIITDSRLLSKEEVDAIGEDNFETLTSRNSDSNARGKLTIDLYGQYYKDSNGVVCSVDGSATWSGFNLIYSETNNPAYGSDFCGFAWSGGYSVQSSSASATFSTGGSQSVYLAEATANAGRVWEFDEYVDLGDNARYYVSNADFNATLKKSTLTGGNNTAEVVMKYIHTYQQKTGSITINAVPQGVGNGFTLSNTSKQWSLSCVIGDFPY